MLEQNKSYENIKASDIMSKDPKYLEFDTLAVEAAKMMNDKKINQIIILKNNDYVGIVHVLDLIKEGIN